MTSITRNKIEYGKPTDPRYLRSIQQRLNRLSVSKKNKDKYKNNTSHISYISAINTISRETILLNEDISQLSSEVKVEKKLAFCFAVLNSDIGENMDYGVLEGIISAFNSIHGSKTKRKKTKRRKGKKLTKRRKYYSS